MVKPLRTIFKAPGIFFYDFGEAHFLQKEFKLDLKVKKKKHQSQEGAPPEAAIKKAPTEKKEIDKSPGLFDF